MKGSHLVFLAFVFFLIAMFTSMARAGEPTTIIVKPAPVSCITACTSTGFCSTSCQ